MTNQHFLFLPPCFSPIRELKLNFTNSACFEFEIVKNLLFGNESSSPLQKTIFRLSVHSKHFLLFPQYFQRLIFLGALRKGLFYKGFRADNTKNRNQEVITSYKPSRYTITEVNLTHSHTMTPLDAPVTSNFSFSHSVFYLFG